MPVKRCVAGSRVQNQSFQMDASPVALASKDRTFVLQPGLTSTSKCGPAHDYHSCRGRLPVAPMLMLGDLGEVERP